MRKSLLVFCNITLLSFNLYSSINDYIYHNKYPTFSNYGTLGYIQNPSARFHQAGTLAFSWSHYDPYLRGSILAYPFDWLEASFQYTDVNNVLYSEFDSFSGSQSYKDKSFDFKVRLLKEREYFPEIALGVRDFGGTGLFASEFLVANKLINNNLDISYGIGWGNLNGNSIKNPLTYISDRFLTREYSEGDEGGEISLDSFFSGSAGYFWSIEYHVPKRKGLKLLFEQDGTNYLTENEVPLVQDSKYNFGIVQNISNKFSVKLFHSRGNTLNFGFSYHLGLGAGKNPQKKKKIKQPDTENSRAVRNVTGRSDDLLYRGTLKYLRDNGIALQQATRKDNSLEVVYSQSAYIDPALSAGRVMKVLDEISPDSISHFKVAEVNGGLGMFSASINRDDYQRYKNFNKTSPLQDELTIEAFQLEEELYEFKPVTDYPFIFNTLSPELRSQIGGPDGFFFGDFKINFSSEILFQRNLSLTSILSYGLYDNMDPLKLASDSVLPRVRTDIVQYLRQSRELSITRMQLNYYGQHNKSLYYKFSAGLFESMFGGVGMELLYRPFNEDYGIGLEVWDVKQREYDQLFDFRDYRTLTGHLTLYYHEPSTNILFKIKGGKYLAKDSGFTFDFSRVFRSGLRIGAFFSLTDISAEEFGEGSFDKGFYFWVPVQLFSENYSKRNWGWGSRPLTRDGAATIIHGHPMWGVTDGASDHLFRWGLDSFYD